MVGAQLRLAGIDPEIGDAVPHVAFARLVPDVAARLRVGGIVVGTEMRGERVLVRVDIRHRRAALGLHQVAALAHLRPGLGIRLHGGPDRDHRLHAHRAQLGHHRIRVGPFGGIEFPLAHAGPVEEVDHDAGQRQAARLVLARDRKQLVLRAIAQLALPESAGPFGEVGRMAGGIGVAREDLARAVAGGDPVVELRCCIRRPAGDVGGELRPPRCRVVPEKAVAARGRCALACRSARHSPGRERRTNSAGCLPSSHRAWLRTAGGSLRDRARRCSWPR